MGNYDHCTDYDYWSFGDGHFCIVEDVGSKHKACFSLLIWSSFDYCFCLDLDMNGKTALEQLGATVLDTQV